METEQQPQQTISSETLRVFYADYGEKALTIHALMAENRRLQELGRQLMERHGPGRCRPAEPETEGG